jgi:two-component system, OmpR family, sensor kinase
MKWNSFRVRLCLWNVMILALVLGEFGLALCYTIQKRMGGIVDRELAARARRWAWGALPRPPRRGPHPPHHRRFRGSVMQAAYSYHWDPFPDQFADAVSGGGDGARAWPYDGSAERVAFFQEPRFLNREGECLAPPSARQAWDPNTVWEAIAGNTRYSTVTVDGERLRVLSVPWRLEGRIAGAVQVARELGEYDLLWDGQVRMLVALLPLSLVIAGIGGVFLTNRALRPVRQVTHAAAQIGAQDLSRRLRVVGQDELAELAATFNGMIARLEAAFEQQRRFTADASHELRTPLARIKVSTSMALSGDQSPGEYRAALAAADQAADAMDRLIQQLLTLARADAGELGLRRERVNMADVLRQAAGGRYEIESARPDQRHFLGTPASYLVPLLCLDLPPDPLEVAGDEDHLSRVFVNLLENAIRHTPLAGRITLSARTTEDAVVVRVADTGEGIAPEHLPRVCERFYRVDAARTRKSGGCGLGLAISRSIIQAHGGRLSIESELGRGTVVTVVLPRCGPDRSRPESPAPGSDRSESTWRERLPGGSSHRSR